MTITPPLIERLAYHQNWKDTLLFYSDGNFRRQGSTCTGIWYYDDQQHLHLNWNRWGKNILKPTEKGHSSPQISLLSVEESRKLKNTLTQFQANDPPLSGRHSLPRLGMMRLWQDKNTIIPALLSSCPVFDRIAITYHAGANEDGCIDLVQDFLREGRQGNCHVTLNAYPYPVYFVHHPWYAENWHPSHPSSFSLFSDTAYRHSILGYEQEPYLWAKLDTDTVYITEALESAFSLADTLYERQLGSKILLLYHDTTPFEGQLWWTLHNKMSGRCADHCLYNPYFSFHGYKLTQGDDEGHIEKRSPHSLGLHREVMPRACGFQFRKSIWLGKPKKVPVRRELLNPLHPNVRDDFEHFLRPILKEGASPYAELTLT